MSTVPDDRWKRRDIKTTQLLAQSIAKSSAVQKGLDDSLLVQDGFINEGSSSNAFIIKDDNIYTPSLSNFILGGITRATVIEFCKTKNIQIKEQKTANQRNIKLGQGGIREVEFFAQYFQLLRGGQILELRSTNCLKTLTVLSNLSTKNLLVFFLVPSHFPNSFLYLDFDNFPL